MTPRTAEPRGGARSEKRTTERAEPSYARIFNIFSVKRGLNAHSTRPEAGGLGGFQFHVIVVFFQFDFDFNFFPLLHSITRVLPGVNGASE